MNKSNSIQQDTEDTYFVTDVGYELLDKYRVSSEGSVLSPYEFAMLVAIDRGIIVRDRTKERYGTEGLKTIQSLLNVD
jgi:hypothetical protein